MLFFFIYYKKEDLISILKYCIIEESFFQVLSIEGFEPPTLWFVAIDSNPLSYIPLNI